MIRTSDSYASLTQLKTWGVFFLYVIVAAYAMSQHEPWGDEIHSWNIAKASANLGELFSNIRYEGHPPVWYLVLWSISKFTHDFAYVQLVQFIIASLVVWIVLFFLTLPFLTRMLIPFGYYFLFEYGVLSRNYVIGVLAAFCICIIIRKDFKYKLPLYYMLILVMLNSHLLALLLAASLHCYFLLWKIDQKENRSKVLLHLLIGIVVCLPAV